MDRRMTIGLIVILVTVAAAAVYFGLRPAPVKAPGAATSAPIANPYVEHTQYYDIAANYPTTTPLSAKASMAAVEVMQSWVINTVSQFKSESGLDRERKGTLQIVYLVSSSPHTVSYIFTTSEDTGGAHPNPFFTTFTFDTTTGKQLALGELFTPGADYLGTLSKIARAELPTIIGQYADQEMIADGTMPDTNNFQNFFVDNATLDILFDPSVVAAYAAGPQTLQIPLSDLASILKPEYKP